MTNRNHQLLPLLAAGLVLTACIPINTTQRDRAEARTTESGARALVEVPLRDGAGPVAVTSPDSGYGSSSGALWVPQGGVDLYAVAQGQVYRVDLASGAYHALADAGAGADRLAGSTDHGLVVATNPLRGDLTLIDETGLYPTMRLPLDVGARAVTLGPEARLAYVAGETTQALTLVDTAVGPRRIADTSAWIASPAAGTLTEVNGDGFVDRRITGLPRGIHSLVLTADGRFAIASYSTFTITGDAGVVGDGEVFLDEGIAIVDLETGRIAQGRVEAPADGSGLSERRANPAGLALVTGGKQAVVALPGWAGVAVFDLTRGALPGAAQSRFIPTDGAPQWVAPGSLGDDWLYTFDPASGVIGTLAVSGTLRRTIRLGR